MGIVAKQSTWNSIALFLGVLLGAVNMMLLFPLVLEPEQFGLTRILVTVGMLAAQFGMMGMPSVLIKFLHDYRKESGKSYGLLAFVLLACLVGFLVVGIAMYFGESIILKPYMNTAKSFSEKYFLVFPLVFFMTLNGVFSTYLKAVFHSVFQLVVSEVIMRLTQTILLILYYYEAFNFDTFLWLFVLIYGFSTLLLVAYLIKIKEFDLKLNPVVLEKSNRKKYYKYGFANFLSGTAHNLSNKIDILMIGAMIGSLATGSNEGLKATAIYAWASYMSSVIEMPGRAIGNIAIPLAAKAWANNNLQEIKNLYRKSSINQMIVGSLVFIGIWMNIDNIIIVLNGFAKDGYDFTVIKYVVLYLGIAKLIHTSTGINGGIIITSKHYMVGTYITIGLVGVTFLTNWILIPIYGIVGAALATALTIFIFNTAAFSFLWVKFNLQPFTAKTILLILIGILTGFIAFIVPNMGHPIVDILLRSIIIVLVYIPLIVGFTVSEDFTALANKISIKFGIRLVK